MPLTIYDQNDPSVAITFDNMPSFQVLNRATFTEHTIEQGTDAIDHKQIRNTQLFLSGRITATPFSATPAATNRIEQARKTVEKLFNTTVVVVSSSGIFRNMQIVSSSYAKTELEEIVFDLTLTQARYATAVVVNIPPRLPPPAFQETLPDEADAGSQANVAPPTLDVSALQTLLQAVPTS